MLELRIVFVRALTLALAAIGNESWKTSRCGTTGGLPPHDEASTPQDARPTLLDCPRAKPAKLAHGIDRRAIGYGHPVASRLASPSMDATFATSTGWTSTD